MLESCLCLLGNFTCSRDDELISRTTKTGSVQSPCYDGIATTYPEELSGRKLINISYGNPAVVGKKTLSSNPLLKAYKVGLLGVVHVSYGLAICCLQTALFP